MPESIRVLAVDDDPDVLELTGAFLGRVEVDLQVTTATGGEAGMDALAESDGRVDCIVSDYDMPSMNGLEFLKAVRDEHPELPFVLFTGKGSEEIASEAIAAGVTDYLQKSQGNEQYEMLANRIVNAVERRRAERRATDLDRINRVIRRVQRGLLAADTRAGVEELVCEEFASADPYEFAWIGVPGEAGALEPRVTAGAAAPQLQTVIETTDAVSRRKGPGAVAARTGDPQTVQDIQTEPRFAPWRSAFGDAGLHSLGAVPLTYDDAEYGVLLVYADRPYAFDEEEMLVLAELGDTIGRAIDATQTSRALDFVNEVVEGVSAGVAAYDEQGEFVYVNAAFADILGYSVDELLATPMWDVEVSLTAENFETYWASFEGGETRTVETEHVTADGDLLPVETTSTHVDIAGDTYHVGTITDISERVERRRELETYARRFEAVFDDPAEFIGLLEPDGTVMQINQTALSFVDTTMADVAGRSFWETPWWSFSEAMQAELRAHISAAADGEFVRFEGENRGSGDTSVTLDTIIRPVRDDDGAIVALIAEGRNITERKHLERELRRSKNALQELYTAASSPGTTFEERLDDVLSTGATHLDMPIASLTELTDDGTLSVVGNQGVNDIQTGDVLDAPLEYQTAAETETVIAIPDVGAVEWAGAAGARWGVQSVVAAPVHVDGEQVGMLWFASPDARTGGFSEFDETYVELLARWASYELEHQYATERLAEQNDRLERFAAIVTHDLRSPLTSAQGWLDLVREDDGDDRLDRVASSLDRMDELIDDIRSMTRSGREVEELHPVSLAAVADAAWTTGGHADAALTIHDDVGHVLAEEGRAKQLLENLFRNAVEHGSTNPRSHAHEDSAEHGSTDNRDAARLDDAIEHAGTTVSVELGRLPTGFYVADDGPGIPEDDRDIVFDHGYTTADQGTGFGLNIVKEAATAHGWDVAVTESESGGARFEITGIEHVDDLDHEREL